MDPPLPHTTQALLDMVAKMADVGITSPEKWRAIGDVVAAHAAWLDRYIRTVGKRPDSFELALEFLGPILEQLRRVEEHLSQSTREWLKLAELHREQARAGLPS